MREFECRTVHGTHIDFFTVANCKTTADPNFKSIMKPSGLDIDEYKIVVSLVMVIKLYGMFRVIFSIMFLCSILKVLKEYS